VEYLLVVLVAGTAGVLFMGIKTYKDAPPKPDYVSSSGSQSLCGLPSSVDNRFFRNML
jgi:nitric oxide reductase large subunit